MSFKANANMSQNLSLSNQNQLSTLHSTYPYLFQKLDMYSKHILKDLSSMLVKFSTNFSEKLLFSFHLLQRSEHYVEEELEFNPKLNAWYFSFKQEIRKFERLLSDKFHQMAEFMPGGSESELARNLKKLTSRGKELKYFLNEEFNFDLEG
jgi:hypothetical protein